MTFLESECDGANSHSSHRESIEGLSPFQNHALLGHRPSNSTTNRTTAEEAPLSSSWFRHLCTKLDIFCCRLLVYQSIDLSVYLIYIICDVHYICDVHCNIISFYPPKNPVGENTGFQTFLMVTYSQDTHFFIRTMFTETHTHTHLKKKCSYLFYVVHSISIIFYCILSWST